MKTNSIGILLGSALAVVTSVAHAVPVVAYEWTEGGPGVGSNSTHVSKHGVRGPVVADDFTPAVSGKVVQIDWWGSAPLPGAPDPDSWEITFHSDVGGAPSTVFPNGVLSQHFVTTNGDGDPDGDGVHMYSASWTPQDLFVSTGVTYWFSAANFQCITPGPAPGPGCLAGWNWANAGGLGPTVGSESFTSHDSFGVAPNGGPHFGPWNALANAQGTKQDLAFRIWVEEVPAPSVIALLGIGLAGIGFARKGI